MLLEPSLERVDDTMSDSISWLVELFQPYHELKLGASDDAAAVGIKTSIVVTPPEEASSVVVAVYVPVHPVVTNDWPGINTSTVSRPSPEAGKIVVVEVVVPVQ
jgi:hypothetical protein